MELRLPDEWTYEGGMLMSNCMCCGRESRTATHAEVVVYEALIANGEMELENQQEFATAVAALMGAFGDITNKLTDENEQLRNRNEMLEKALVATGARINDLAESIRKKPDASLLDLVMEETEEQATRPRSA